LPPHLSTGQDGSPPKKVAGNDTVPVEGETEEDPASVVTSSEVKLVESSAEAAIAAVEAPVVAQQ
jgi:hypothetical protein